MTKEEILEILENSQVLKVANLKSFSTNANLYITFKDMDNNSNVFETKLLQLNDRFILRAYNEKTNFSYEYIKNQKLKIEVINLKKYDENIEILSVTDKNNQELSINITDNKTNNRVISIGKKSFSVSLNENNYSQKILIDLGINDIIRYQEINNEKKFTLRLFRINQKIHLVAHNNLENTKTNYTFSNKSLYKCLYDFIYNDYILETIENVLSAINEKLPYALQEIKNYEIIDDLYLLGEKKNMLSKLFGKNNKISNVIDENRKRKEEKNKQKKLHI